MPRRAGWAVPDWLQRLGRASWALIGVTLALALVVALLAALREVVVPLVVAMFAGVVVMPLVDALQRRRVPRAAAALLVAMLVVVIALIIAGVTVASVTERSAELSAQLQQAADRDTLRDALAAATLRRILDLDWQRASELVAGGPASVAGSLLGSAAGLVSGLVLALVLLYYLLKDGRRMVMAVAVRRDPQTTARIERVLGHAAASLRAYSRGRTMLAAVQALFIWAAMSLLGVPLPLTIATVNFFGAFVPFLGAFIGGAFALVMALSEGGLVLAGWALAAVLVMNLVVENLLEPRVVGDPMRLHPVVVLLATVAGGLLAGLFGLVFAAPAVAVGTTLLTELRGAGFFDTTPAEATDGDDGPQCREPR